MQNEVRTPPGIQTYEEAVRPSHRNPRIQEFARKDPDVYRSAWSKVEAETERLHRERDWRIHIFLIMQQMYFHEWTDNDVWDFILPIMSKKVESLTNSTPVAA